MQESKTYSIRSALLSLAVHALFLAAMTVQIRWVT